MTFRFAAILGVLLVGLTGSIGAVWSLAPDRTANDTAIVTAGQIMLAATNDEIKACKQACSDKYGCLKTKTIGYDPVRADCLKKAKACKVACNK